ncbi:hypothetical protein NF868_02010 [Bacillus zhangzhouensis]|nr:hypothetical protein NF868_02010 [Bacillus zhangzhouensis]
MKETRTVEEAILSIQELPVVSNVPIMLADRKGEAAGLTIHNDEELFGTYQPLHQKEGMIDYCFGSPVYNPTYF